MTWGRLAEAAGVSPMTLHRIGNYEVKPNRSTMQAIAAALGVEVGEVSEFAAASEELSVAAQGHRKDPARMVEAVE